MTKKLASEDPLDFFSDSRKLIRKCLKLYLYLFIEFIPFIKDKTFQELLYCHEDFGEVT